MDRVFPLLCFVASSGYALRRLYAARTDLRDRTRLLQRAQRLGYDFRAPAGGDEEKNEKDFEDENLVPVLFPFFPPSH
jgi:hypothetical protein